ASIKESIIWIGELRHMHRPPPTILDIGIAAHPERPLRPRPALISHVLAGEHAVSSAAMPLYVSDAKHGLKVRRRQLVIAAIEPAGVLQELRVVVRHAGVFGVVYKLAVLPALQQD